MVTWENSVGKMFFVLSKESDTSARLAALRFLVPLKMMFSIFSDRSMRVLCSPSTHRMASTTLDLPQPFGPTMAVTPSLKWMVILSPKLLKPFISSLVSCIYPRWFPSCFRGEFRNLERVFLLQDKESLHFASLLSDRSCVRLFTLTDLLPPHRIIKPL